MFVSLLPAPPGYVSCSQLALEHSEKVELARGFEAMNRSQDRSLSFPSVIEVGSLALQSGR